MDVAPESKEFLWCAKLNNSAKTNQWEGRDDGVLEQLVLKRACLGKGAKDGEKNLVEVTSFNFEQEKIEACICCLRGGAKDDVSLGDLTIFPPAIFKLLEGNGPIHIVGNHMMMDDGDDLSDEDQEDFSEEDVSEEDLSDMEEEIPAVKPKGVKGQPPKAVKASVKDDAKPKKGGKKQVKVEEDEDESDLDDEFDEEDGDEMEVPEVKVEAKKTPTKKRKLTNGEEKAGDENKKPENTPTQNKKKKKVTEGSTTPTTPLQQKENKSPQSAKKTPAKVYESVDEVKAAIKKYPGGKPRKEDKFCNWVKSAFKVKDDEWMKELWQAHKKDLGI